MEAFKIISEDNLNIGVSNLKYKEFLKNQNVELIDNDLKFKRFYHYIILDKDIDIKKVFRALRNGGYLLSTIKYDDNLLYDIGFSAISKIDEFFIIKKVHSWNDF